MMRVVLPFHLRNLANVTAREIQVQIEGPATIGALLDEIEARYPMLRGTIRDQLTGQRRPFIRFFACGQDLSHEPPDTLLPALILQGAEPFMVVGAMAGG